MASDIDTYLKELQATLAGADPALVQDALFDAEEHFQAESAAGRGFAEIVDDYGTPAEVAAAYMAATTAAVAAGPAVTAVTPVPVPAPPADQAVLPPPAGPSVWHQIFGVFYDPRVWKSLLYMIISLATGIFYFTVVITMLSTSFGTSILIIGLPLLLLTLGFVRGMALFEGRLVEFLLGIRMPRRPRAEFPGSFLQRLWFWLKDGRTWASMVYLVLMLPVGIVYFTFAVTGLALGLGLIGLPIVQLAVGHTWIEYGNNGINEWLLPGWSMPLWVIAGFLVLLGCLHAFRWIGRGHAAYAKAMLVRLAK